MYILKQLKSMFKLECLIARLKKIAKDIWPGPLTVIVKKERIQYS
ncbi:MAG: hypothetical protein CM15mP109_15750 [Candidatus Dadabacteria bacterium]|nr:MAG: hypothetical protein CM15mP109_15750 [Candidatus Dadabacteria bacterium]